MSVPLNDSALDSLTVATGLTVVLPGLGALAALLLIPTARRLQRAPRTNGDLPDTLVFLVTNLATLFAAGLLSLLVFAYCRLTPQHFRVFDSWPVGLDNQPFNRPAIFALPIGLLFVRGGLKEMFEDSTLSPSEALVGTTSWVVFLGLVFLGAGGAGFYYLANYSGGSFDFLWLIVCVVAFFVSGFVLRFLWQWFAASGDPASSTIRGKTFVDIKTVAKWAAREDRTQVAPTPASSPTYSWGGVLFPPQMLDPHFAILGTTGSGKTLLFRCLMKSVLPTNSGERAVRAIVYDRKRELYPILLGMGVAENRVFVMNPFDARTTAWDMAADVTTPAEARELAATLLPKDPQAQDNEYFSKASQDILRGLILTFCETAPRNWSLNDLLEATSNPQRLTSVLGRSQDGRDLVATYLSAKAEATASNIVSTIRSRLGIFETVARCWSRTLRKVSLHDWYQGRGVLLLGSDDKSDIAMSAINRALFATAQALITSRTDERPADETWVFFDEVREAGRMDALTRLLNTGRSKGAHVVMGFTDIEGLRDLYGRERANELVGQAGNTAVLRLNNPVTEEWAANFFGKYEYWQKSFGKTDGPQGDSSNVNRQLRETFAILPQEFHNFPPTNETTGLTGAFTAPDVGAWKAAIPWSFLRANIGSPAQGVPGFVPRPVSDQARNPWTPGDFARLGVPSAPADDHDDGLIALDQ